MGRVVEQEVQVAGTSRFTLCATALALVLVLPAAAAAGGERRDKKEKEIVAVSDSGVGVAPRAPEWVREQVAAIHAGKVERGGEHVGPGVGPQTRNRISWYGCKDVWAYRGYDHWLGYNLFRYYQQVSWCSNGYTIYSVEPVPLAGAQRPRLGVRRPSRLVPRWLHVPQAGVDAGPVSRLPHVVLRLQSAVGEHRRLSRRRLVGGHRRLSVILPTPRLRGAGHLGVAVVARGAGDDVGLRQSDQRVGAGQASGQPHAHRGTVKTPGGPADGTSSLPGLPLDSRRVLGGLLHADRAEDPGRLPLRGRLVGDPGRAGAARGRPSAGEAHTASAGLRLACQAPTASAAWAAAARRPAGRGTGSCRLRPG